MARLAADDDPGEPEGVVVGACGRPAIGVFGAHPENIVAAQRRATAPAVFEARLLDAIPSILTLSHIMNKKPSPDRKVREPVQVYLDGRDRGLLDALATRAAMSRAEVLRLGLRRLAADMLGDTHAGASVQSLIGALDAAPGVPADLAARHDEYLYAPKRTKKRASR